MISRSILGIAAALLIAGTSIASAQTTPPAPPAAKATVAKTKVKKTAVPAKPRSEISLACSAKATEQGLTGKKRTSFRRSCMKKKAA